MDYYAAYKCRRCGAIFRGRRLAWFEDRERMVIDGRDKNMPQCAAHHCDDIAVAFSVGDFVGVEYA